MKKVNIASFAVNVVDNTRSYMIVDNIRNDSILYFVMYHQVFKKNIEIVCTYFSRYQCIPLKIITKKYSKYFTGDKPICFHNIIKMYLLDKDELAGYLL